MTVDDADDRIPTIDEHIQTLVRDWRPLTAEQLDRLAVIFGVSRLAAPAEPPPGAP